MAPASGTARWWAIKGGAGLLDQALSSATGFLVSILAARYLEPGEYGAFAVSYSVFLLAAALHTAVVTEPMMAFGAGRYRDRFAGYLRILVRGHLAITAAGALVVALAAGVTALLGSPALARCLGAVALSLPSVLLWWLVRRALYARLRPALAAAGSGFSLVVSVGAILALRAAGLLSAAAVLAVLAASGLAAAGLLLPSLLASRADEPGVPLRAVLADHWRFGGWNTLATGLYWASGQIVVVVVPVFLGLGASGVLAAVSNLFRPLNVLFQSVSLLVISGFSSQRGQGDRDFEGAQQPGRAAVRLALPVLTTVGAAILYGALATGFSGPLLSLFYTGKYDAYAVLVPVFALSHTASGLLQALSAALKALGDTRAVASTWAVSAALVAALSVPALELGGLVGIMGLVVLSYFVAAAMAWRRLRLALADRPAS